MTHRIESSGTRARLRALIAACAVGTALGCGGPERAPRQPITGVDRPAEERAPNPHDEPAAEPEEDEDETEGSETSALRPGAPGSAPPSTDTVVRGDLIAAFSAQVASAQQSAPGPVAVFWPLSPDPLRPGVRHVNGLGERVAREIADGLRAEGISPLAGAALRNDIQAANRCLHHLRDVDDVFWIAQRLGVEYVVYGTISVRNYNKLSRDTRMEFRLHCKRLNDNIDVARLQRSFTWGERLRDYYRDYQHPSEIRIGIAAAPCTNSASAEATYLMSLLTRRVISQSGRALAGKRLLVEPTAIRSASQTSAEVAAQLAAVGRAYAAALQRAADANAKDPRGEALGSGPVTILGTEHATLGSAVDAAQAAVLRSGATPPLELAVDLSRALGESLTRFGESMEVITEDPQRASIFALLRSGDDANDTVASYETSVARARGADFLVRSTLRPYLGTYQLRLMLIDSQSGKVHSEVISFDEQFKADLDAVTAG